MNELLLTCNEGLYIVAWISILNPDYGYQPPKSISLVVMGREHGPGLAVCLLLLRLTVQKNVPDPAVCLHSPHILTGRVPACRVF